MNESRVQGRLGALSMGAAACLLILFACLPSASSAEDKPKRILMLYSYNFTFPTTTAIGNAALRRLQERMPTSIIDAEFLDLLRVTSHDETIAYLHRKYASSPPDVVVTIGLEALPFSFEHRDAIAPRAPLVFSAIDLNHPLVTAPPPGVTGVALDAARSLENTIKLVETLQPDVRQLYIIAGSGNLDQNWQETARRVIDARESKFDTTFLFGLSFGQLTEEVPKLPRDSAVIVLSIFGDGTGRTLSTRETASTLARLSPVPFYSPYSGLIGQGILGGFSETAGSHGNAVGDLVVEILEGKSPSEIPPRINPGLAYRVDYQTLQKWNLSESKLPQGTVIVGKEPTIWDQHRGLIIGTLLVIALQSAFLVALLVQRRLRRRAEAEAALQRQEVEHLTRVSVLGELSGAIAHEINQPLAAIQTNAETGLDLVATQPPDIAELRGVLEDIVHDNGRASEVIQRLRNLMKRGDRKTELIDLNEIATSTVALLKSELIARKVNVAVDLQTGPLMTFGDPVQLQQVLLNLIMNAMDAMDATPPAQRRIAVSTRRDKTGAIEVAVEDEGRGIDPADQDKIFQPFHTTKANGLGLGLTICSTIIRAHGGTLALRNAKGSGAIATFSLPAHEMHVAAK